MLLWEVLSVPTDQPPTPPTNGHAPPPHTMRLPYDKRCAAITKGGTRCRGKIRSGGDFCIFHDPELAAKRRRRPTPADQKRRRLMHLPDGYLRKLTSIRTVGEAMDRLYREVRLGIVTVEMGEVLLSILTRMVDSALVTTGPCPERTRAAKIRPKVSELLTRGERAAWRRAVDNGMASSILEERKPGHGGRPVRKAADGLQPAVASEKPAKLRLQAAS